MRSSILLALLITGLWTALYLVTQVVVDDPLAVLPTVAAGTALTVLAVLIYPSAVPGRRTRAQSRSERRDHLDRGVRDLAAAGRSAPLRSGLTPDAAKRTVELLRPMLSGDAISITDRTDILAFVGPGSDHHKVNHPLRTKAARRTIDKGKTVVVGDRHGLACSEPDCELTSAVISPLMVGSRVVGSLGVFQASTQIPSRKLVEDMASMLSLHLELADMDRERQLATDARLDALRAQINPHFLFNILNTIASKARTHPEEARTLLVRLSEFFRYAVKQEGHFAEFAQEYFFVRTYLTLEQARFQDRLEVLYDIDPRVLTSHIPVLTMQPLVENAVKHGIAAHKEGGTVRLRARVDPLSGTTSIRVSDDGVGMEPDELSALMDSIGQQPPTVERARATENTQHAGVGLRNITERLHSLFGDRYDLSISSSTDRGTVVDLRIPLK